MLESTNFYGYLSSTSGNHKTPTDSNLNQQSFWFYQQFLSNRKIA